MLDIVNYFDFIPEPEEIDEVKDCIKEETTGHEISDEDLEILLTNYVGCNHDKVTRLILKDYFNPSKD